MSLDACVICQLPEQKFQGGGTSRHFRASCARCGTYEWEGRVPNPDWERLAPRLSGFVRDQNRAGIIPVFNAELVESVRHVAVPGLLDRSNRLLAGIVAALEDPQGIYGLEGEPQWLAITFSRDEAELDLLLRILSDRGLASDTG